jgi:hypothetical protein
MHQCFFFFFGEFLVTINRTQIVQKGFLLQKLPYFDKQNSTPFSVES